MDKDFSAEDYVDVTTIFTLPLKNGPWLVGISSTKVFNFFKTIEDIFSFDFGDVRVIR